MHTLDSPQLRDICHDLNNLHAVISGYTEYLMAQLKPADPMQETLSQIKAAVDRAALLSDQLFLTAR